MQEVAAFINTVGFPIFVSVFFLFRLEKTLKDNARTNAQLLVYLQRKNGDLVS